LFDRGGKEISLKEIEMDRWSSRTPNQPIGSFLIQANATV
jgi:hypothetical protein